MSVANEVAACVGLFTEAIDLAAKGYELQVVISLVSCRDSLPASPDPSPGDLRAAIAALDETQQTIREAGANAAILQRLRRLRQVKAMLVALRDQRARHYGCEMAWSASELVFRREQWGGTRENCSVRNVGRAFQARHLETGAGTGNAPLAS